MNQKSLLALAALLVAAAMGVVPVSAEVDVKKMASPPAAPLTEAGKKLEAQYAEMLKGLQAEIIAAIPKINEPKREAFLKAREAVKQANVLLGNKQKPMSAITSTEEQLQQRQDAIKQTAKNMAEAEKQIKAATTPQRLKVAQEALAIAQADATAATSALVVTQAAMDKVNSEKPKVVRELQAAKEALAQAEANQLMKVQAILPAAGVFLASDKVDAKLIKCAVLAEATPRGLAEFAQRGKEQEALAAKLLADTPLMGQMLEAGGAKAGKYGQAMQIYDGIQKASSRAKEGIFHRLALGTSLEHAVPIEQRNVVTETSAPTTVDPVKRYLHYEKAYLDGELDPAFKDMTAWECRYITDSYAPDHILAWGREMLRNYRPDHILNPNYGWRYAMAVRTDVPYRHGNEFKDSDSLHYLQNIIKNGGICGRRAFFGSFICKSFGLPTWGVLEHAHAAVGRWTPRGWVVILGYDWDVSWYEGRRGWDFQLETQAREHPQDYVKVLRAQWVGNVLGEPKYDSSKPGSGGLWNMLSFLEKKAIVAVAKPTQLAALGMELREANESAETMAMAVVKAPITDADKKITIAPNGVITIPPAACKGAQVMRSFAGGQQMSCGGNKLFSFEVEAPTAGKYAFAARVVTVHDEMRLLLTVNNSPNPVGIAIPYTCGQWQTTKPVEVALVQGKNTLSFSKPADKFTFTIKHMTLTPVK